MPTVEDYMTAIPHIVQAHEGITTARNLMQRYEVRHLAVYREGKLAGIVSDRDLASAQGFAGPHAATLTVENVMTPDPYTVRLNAPLNHVARTMAEHKYGSAVVVDGTGVIGILTTVDALHALADTLEGRYTRAALEGVARTPRRGQTRPTSRHPR